ncbi:hypothetical protein [Fulvitalea axinellae]
MAKPDNPFTIDLRTVDFSTFAEIDSVCFEKVVSGTRIGVSYPFSRYDYRLYKRLDSSVFLVGLEGGAGGVERYCALVEAEKNSVRMVAKLAGDCSFEFLDLARVDIKGRTVKVKKLKRRIDCDSGELVAEDSLGGFEVVF